MHVCVQFSLMIQAFLSEISFCEMHLARFHVVPLSLSFHHSPTLILYQSARSSFVLSLDVQEGKDM